MPDIRGPEPTPTISLSPQINLKREPADHPLIAWPTVFLTIAAGSLAAGSHYLTLVGPFKITKEEGFDENSNNLHHPVSLSVDFSRLMSFTYLLHFMARSVLVFVLFQGAHDAGHCSVARGGFKWLNEFIGHFCATFIGAPFLVWRKIHNDHHKYVQHEKFDPDLFSAGGFAQRSFNTPFVKATGLRYLLLPLHCMTQLYHYLYHVAKYYFYIMDASFLLGNLVIVFIFLVIPILSVFTERYNYLFFGFHVPTLGGVGILAFAFDFLPHRPHDTTQKIASTSLITLFDIKTDSKGNLSPEAIDKESGLHFLTPFFFGQNMHSLHHLWCDIPFYRYTSLWHRHKQDLCDAGLEAHPIWPLFIERKKKKER